MHADSRRQSHPHRWRPARSRRWLRDAGYEAHYQPPRQTNAQEEEPSKDRQLRDQPKRRASGQHRGRSARSGSGFETAPCFAAMGRVGQSTARRLESHDATIRGRPPNQSAAITALGQRTEARAQNRKIPSPLSFSRSLNLWPRGEGFFNKHGRVEIRLWAILIRNTFRLSVSSAKTSP